VASPTFTLADVHTGGREILNHLDLYRLGGGGAPEDALKEFLEAGLDERLDEGLTLVEWPERLPEGYWPEGRVTVRFIMLVSGRVMEVSLPYPGAGPDTAERLTGALRARGIAPYAPGSPGAPRACGS
jgi:tRNA A37 threonylcarbamoyladenosine biosynthesis protein TsaE